MLQYQRRTLDRLSPLSHQACASDTVAPQNGALASYPIIQVFEVKFSRMDCHLDEVLLRLDEVEVAVRDASECFAVEERFRL